MEKTKKLTSSENPLQDFPTYKAERRQRVEEFESRSRIARWFIQRLNPQIKQDVRAVQAIEGSRPVVIPENETTRLLKAS